MSTFKCKICGGELETQSGQTVAVCEYCGVKQTLPKLDDEKRANLYDRANHFRRNNEFDKASAIYEQILNEENTDAEAYWSLVLCRYGIEYVEDPVSHKRVPTVHRAQYTSIFDDDNYKQALKNADFSQKIIYEDEAKAINEIQKGFLAISQKEKPFDVFICYKETDSHGKRTQDSVLAQDLYYQLTEQGFKVFFARITLEDKLGSAYEPYIFAALNSAKVMVVLGTKPEFFNAVWVKNEWSRFLSLIKNGEKKMLIPAYKDMDPYDLPTEFSHLQAQDMSKLGFMQDLIHGIKKIARKTPPQTIVKETVVADNHQDLTPLLRRAYLFLEDGDFDKAEEYTEKVLDTTPECAEAYFIKLLIEYGLQKPELLSQSETIISESLNYKKALRFADEKFGKKLVGYNDSILSNIENKRKENIYQSACKSLADRCYLKAIDEFSKIVNYKDSSQKIEICQDSIEKERKEKIYKNALAKIAYTINPNHKIAMLEQSISELQSISGYKDADKKTSFLQSELEKCYQNKKIAEEQAKIKAEEERLKKLQEAELRKIKAEKTKKTVKKVAKIAILSILAIAVVLVLTFTLFIPTEKYNKANDMCNSGNYEEALKIYEDLDGFSGSGAKIATINAVKTVKNGAFEKGVKDALKAGVKVNLTYELNGGEFSHPNKIEETLETEKTYTFDKVEEFSGLISTARNGYNFDKWDLVSCNAEVTKRDNTINIHLIAVWNAKKYAITYDLDGGSITTYNPIGYDPNDATFTLVNPIKRGYTFIGWTGTDLTDKTMEVTIPSDSYGDRSYTANWQANTYIVRYDANGGSVTKEIDVAIYDKQLLLAQAERRGYTFLGWFSNQTKYNDIEKWNDIEDLNLTAMWQINTYTISYILNGGSVTNATEYTVEEDVTLKQPYKTGYTFLGWSGMELTQLTKALVITKGSVGNKQYVANWQANTYSITYNTNGGTCSKNEDIATYDENFSPLTPSRIGYDFVGWKLNENFYAGGIWEKTSNITLVAEWRAKSYTITYDGNGGAPSTTQTVLYDDDFILSNATRIGYTLIGWKYNGVKFNAGKWNMTTNITLVAEWKANTYIITYNGNGGASSAEMQAVVYDSYPILAIAQRVGYTFVGWYSDSTKYISEKVWKTAKNITLTAKWTANTNTPYTVKHYQQNVNDNNYTLFDTQGFTGTSDANITPAVMSYTGFTSPSVQTTIISPDGGKTVEYYYTRNTYTITLVSNGGTGSSITQKYQSALNKMNWSTRNGFTFGGWFTDRNLTTEFAMEKMPAQNHTVYAWWEEENKPTDFVYNCSSVINISSYNGNSSSVHIPAYIGGVAVTKILSRAFENQNTLTAIYLPSTITDIESYAFYGCSTLNYINSNNESELVIPDSVLTIGEYSFSGLPLINKIRVPNSVIEIGLNAFSECSAIERVELPFVGKNENSTEKFDYIFGTCVNNIKSVSITNDATIPTSAFYQLSMIESITLCDKTISIGEKAFYKCVGLKKIVIPKTVEEINGSAFYKCTNLVAVIYENDSCLTNVGAYAFSGCSSLLSIEIPTKVHNIGEKAYTDCTAVRTIYYNAINCNGFSSNTRIFVGLGDSVNKVSVTIGNLVEIIPSCLFTSWHNYDTSYITEVIFAEESVCKTIGSYAFCGCAITTITIPKSIIIIKTNAFAECNSLINVAFELGSKLDTIETCAFSGCHLTSFRVPKGVTSIRGQTFYCCHYLEYIIIPNTVTSIGNSIIEGSNSIDVFYEGDETSFNQIQEIYVTDNSLSWRLSTKYFYDDNEPQLNEEGTAYNGNYWHYVDGVPSIWVYNNEE